MYGVHIMMYMMQIAISVNQHRDTGNVIVSDNKSTTFIGINLKMSHEINQSTLQAQYIVTHLIFNTIDSDDSLHVLALALRVIGRLKE